MRERGDLAAFTGTGEEGATATDSVAACICLELRRQYAIRIIASTRREPRYGPRILPNVLSSEVAPLGHGNARFRTFERSLAPNRRLSDQIGDSVAEFDRARTGPMVTTKTSTKAKARTMVRAFGELDGFINPEL